MATPEKAFLDLVYLRLMRPDRQPFGEWNLEHLDLDKLREEAEGFPERVRRTVDLLAVAGPARTITS